MHHLPSDASLLFVLLLPVGLMALGLAALLAGGAVILARRLRSWARARRARAAARGPALQGP
ncbi:MAG: hypothetical protein KQH53_01845 [Desulfarculaceae bacterium]|nr:hypothetical protein [Desulfarculaceae bacterium]